MAFTVYRAIKNGLSASILMMEQRIEDLAKELEQQAIKESELAELTAQRDAATTDSELQSANDAIEAFNEDYSADRSVSVISLEMQMYTQEWSFMLQLSTNLMKSFGDGLLAVARNM